MTNQVDRDAEVEAMVSRMDAQIEELTARGKDGGPELRKQCQEEISTLIANREAVRRGLLRVTESGELCSSCPEEVTEPGSEGKVEVCENIDDPIRRGLCKVCGLPVLGEAPFCKDHEPPVP